MTLEISDLSIHIGDVELVSIPELVVPTGRRTGLVGESGSGKTLTALSIVGLQPRAATVRGRISLDGLDLLTLSAKEFAGVRGNKIGFVFQDPLRALNPVMRIGWQLAQAICLHSSMSRQQARRRALDLLRQVSLPDGEALLRRYPHQLSGGQRQRVVIALAVANDPSLLIADEPTTALDVTVQRDVLELLTDVSAARNMSMLFVSHDLGVVESVCEDVAVMYGGGIVERGPIAEVVRRPKHRYTQALIDSSPDLLDESTPPDLATTPMATIPGVVPGAGEFPGGCRFRNRCAHESEECSRSPSETVLAETHSFRCWNPVGEETLTCR